MKFGVISGISLSAILAIFLGCTGDRLSDDGVSLSRAPLLLVDGDGKRWTRGAKAVIASAAEEAAFERSLPAIMRERALELADARANGELEEVKDLSLDALAESLKAIRLVNGYEYISEPDYPFAKRVRSGAFDNFGLPASAAVDPDLPIEEDMEGMFVFGTDDRWIARNNSTYPHSAQILLTNTSGGGARCSATMIGPSTALTAAHCLHSGTAWFSTRGWAPGVDSRDANPFTYDPTPSSNCSAYPHSCSAARVQGCYEARISASFSGALTIGDFAVIEFQKAWWNGAGFVCNQDYATMNDKPGNSVGWFGVWNETEAQIENPNTAFYLHGYPGELCNGDCYWPSIWGRGSPNHGANATGWQIVHYNDSSGGQSGAAVWHFETHNNVNMRWAIGVHLGGFTEHECSIFGCDYWSYHVARRVDSTFAAFILAQSSL